MKEIYFFITYIIWNLNLVSDYYCEHINNTIYLPAHITNI